MRTSAWPASEVWGTSLTVHSSTRCLARETGRKVAAGFIFAVRPGDLRVHLFETRNWSLCGLWPWTNVQLVLPADIHQHTWVCWGCKSVAEGRGLPWPALTSEEERAARQASRFYEDEQPAPAARGMDDGAVLPLAGAGVTGGSK